uniref:NADH dehydrogenase subunit 5 n=1 Tax=Xyloredo nooi TaxID=2584333 RepID=UPI0020287E99|nr:NADH dehydrogenase subunit 5 [Xyloredo nooi]UPX88990.1 NADH dehydrogenase subunit 5 [Xyloredo nooi]UPX89002.1 NADH dehydrogenase subunit 5 [Xyloredo nooi]
MMSGFGLNRCIYVFLSSFLVFFSVVEVFLLLGAGSKGFEVLVLDVDFSSIGGFLCCVPLVFDWSSVVFSCSVLVISASVMLFCCFYMSHEVHAFRFCFMVVLFVMFMNFLIFIPSVFGMMLGWDGLGVVSFLLVVYYNNSESLGAGVITALSNRVGDALFVLFICISLSSMSWHFFDFVGLVEPYLVGLLVIASMTKSAQVPFSAWLPAAMAAPTPVSALVHSSTLVTAGVYVLFRFYEVIQGGFLVLLGVISMMTVILAGMSAVVEVDFKKIVAFSTLSQLGMMMLALSLGLKNVCFYHLITHAFFKALMFLCVGSVIFMGGGLQDVRFFSGLWFKMPIISSWVVVCCFSLVGIPFMSGFYSKDLIVEGFIFNDSSLWGVLLLFFSVVLTAIYSGRLLLMLFSSFSFFSLESFNDKNPFLLMSVFMLGVGAVFMGFILQKSVLFLNSFVWVPMYFKVLTLGSVFLGFFLSFLAVSFKSFVNSSVKVSVFKGFFFWLVSLMWFLPALSGGFTSKVGLSTCLEVSMVVEKGWMDWYVLKVFLGSLFYEMKVFLRFLQSEGFVGWLLVLSLVFLFIFTV